MLPNFYGVYRVSIICCLKPLLLRVEGDHGLRGEESAGDARFVAARARALGLPVRERSVAPGPLREGTSSRERLTLQEAARALRYEALYAMACSADGDSW